MSPTRCASSRRRPKRTLVADSLHAAFRFAPFALTRTSPPSFSPLLLTEVDESGTASAISDDNICATTPDFSEFAFASNSQMLPVKIATFAATADGRFVSLLLANCLRNQQRQMSRAA